MIVKNLCCYAPACTRLLCSILLFTQEWQHSLPCVRLRSVLPLLSPDGTVSLISLPVPLSFALSTHLSLSLSVLLSGTEDQHQMLWSVLWQWGLYGSSWASSAVVKLMKMVVLEVCSKPVAYDSWRTILQGKCVCLCVCV